MVFGPGGPLRGSACLPGDKSISHRALMLAAMARGHSLILGLSDGSDVDSTPTGLAGLLHRDGAWAREDGTSG